MRSARLLSALALVVSAACDRAEPPTRPEAQPATGQARPAGRRLIRRPSLATPSPDEATPAPIDAAEAPRDAAAALANDAGQPDGSAPSAESGLAALAPKLVAPDGKPLEQTEDKPSLESKWFKAGLVAVFRAIQMDDPGPAEAFFFPVEGYRQVKDVADPDRDYRRRLIANFRRDVHDYHQRLGPHAAEARFVGIDVPVERMRWMKPHTEGNKRGYYRVTHSRLRYDNAEGKPLSLEVTSFISWRGEWYLVHLNGFK